MKIVYAYPPNYTDILERFGELEKTVVFTYGDTIYSPMTQEIPHNLGVHETVHMHQQGDDPEGWWDRYLRDDEFRLSQEVEAYYTQYEFVKQEIKDRNLLTRFLMKIAADLSGPMYGNIVTHRQAFLMIRRGRIDGWS